MEELPDNIEVEVTPLTPEQIEANVRRGLKIAEAAGAYTAKEVREYFNRWFPGAGFEDDT